MCVGTIGCACCVCGCASADSIARVVCASVTVWGLRVLVVPVMTGAVGCACSAVWVCAAAVCSVGVWYLGR